MLIAAAVLLALVAVGLAVGFAVNGSSGSSTRSVPTRGSLANSLPGALQVQRLLKGIPQHGNVLGSPTAPATLIEYVDLQCPFCRQFETQNMPTVIERYVRTGKAKMELRPLAFIGPDSQSGRSALIAAGKQNRMFNFAELLYLNQGGENTGWLSEDLITAAAASIPGLDVPRLLEEQSSAATDREATAFDRLAERDQVQATPTILVGRSEKDAKLVVLKSPADVQTLSVALDRALR